MKKSVDVPADSIDGVDALDSDSKRGSGERLREGIDFTLEAGQFVLTRKYLLERGYCCKLGCRNCPYGSLCES